MSLWGGSIGNKDFSLNVENKDFYPTIRLEIKQHSWKYASIKPHCSYVKEGPWPLGPMLGLARSSLELTGSNKSKVRPRAALGDGGS